MPKLERTRTVRFGLDGIVGLAQLEAAPIAFAREAPAQPVADVVESMIADLVNAVVGPFGVPLAEHEQLKASCRAPGAGAAVGSAGAAFGPSPAK